VAYLRDVEADSPAIAEYLAGIDATLTPYDGEFLVHGTTPVPVEGEWPGSIVIIRFPSVDHARSWYESPDYQAILPLRTGHSHSIAAFPPRGTARLPRGRASGLHGGHKRNDRRMTVNPLTRREP
jgi:uncharacterized protein (DUF1330 family)